MSGQIDIREHTPEIQPIILNEDQLTRLLASDEDMVDGVLSRSLRPKRQLVRPSVKWASLLLDAFLLMLSIVIFPLSLFLPIPSLVKAILILLASVLFCIVLKPLLFETIRVYQRFAPSRIRLRCKCEPSCSDYMSEAIRKYGLLKGVRMGYQRLQRCGVKVCGKDPLP